MRDDLCVGGLYLSNNPCFPGQIFQVIGIEPVRERFGRPNRIVHYRRWAHRASTGWYLVEVDQVWETNGARNEFGEVVPAQFQSEIPMLAA